VKALGPPKFAVARARLFANPDLPKERNIQRRRAARLQVEMKKHEGNRVNGRPIVDQAMTATERMELYCARHPESPSAVRRPQLTTRGQLWIALLGSSVEEGIVGIGPTVQAALRAFDAQYMAGLHPPAGAVTSRRALPRSILSAS
jgi:hypothetical protein